MAKIISLSTYSDNRGNLTVIDRILPFNIARVFFIYGVDNSKRGGHRHHKTVQAAVCIKGRCSIYNNNSHNEEVYDLDNPSKCLLIEPIDWHVMFNFSEDAILMVFASEYYDPKDYIYEEYPNSIRKP